MIDSTRLEKFTNMRDEVLAEYESVSCTLDEMRIDNKTKTATFKQLTARKLTLSAIIAMYRKHGLI